MSSTSFTRLFSGTYANSQQEEVDKGLLRCTSCNEPVGVKDQKQGNLQLFKWSLAVQRSLSTIWETYSVPEVVSAQLLAFIAEQAIYKFLVYTDIIEEAKEALLVRQPQQQIKSIVC